MIHFEVNDVKYESQFIFACGYPIFLAPIVDDYPFATELLLFFC